MTFRNGYGRTEPRGRLTISARLRDCMRRDGTVARNQPMLIRTHDAHYRLHFSF